MKDSAGNAGGTTTPAADLPLHRSIYETLLEEIQNGQYKPGERLPSEAVLCERFQASRITVAKAIQGLQRDKLVTRRAGSGTYVEAPAQATALQFGLLIPELGSTDIFEPICRGMMQSKLGRSHSLTWGSTSTDEKGRDEAAEQLCLQYVTQKVAGVFFAPLEFSVNHREVNERIIAALEKASIPVVLLDRCYKQYPERSAHDLVGIDNHRAGYVLTKHLLQSGAKRVVFLARPGSASTVDARIAGYRLALNHHPEMHQGAVCHGQPGDAHFMQAMLQEERPDAIVCANDLTAARAMQTILSLGMRIPDEIRIVGVDDVSYANFLPVPLTTIQQDCNEIGAVAMSAMFDRLERPDRPAKDFLVSFELIVRDSCGSIAG